MRTLMQFVMLGIIAACVWRMSADIEEIKWHLIAASQQASR